MVTARLQYRNKPKTSLSRARKLVCTGEKGGIIMIELSRVLCAPKYCSMYAMKFSRLLSHLSHLNLMPCDLYPHICPQFNPPFLLVLHGRERSTGKRRTKRRTEEQREGKETASRSSWTRMIDPSSIVFCSHGPGLSSRRDV